MTTYKLKANGKYGIESGSDGCQPFDFQQWQGTEPYNRASVGALAQLVRAEDS